MLILCGERKSLNVKGEILGKFIE